MPWRNNTLPQRLFASTVIIAACDPAERDVASSLPPVHKDAPLDLERVPETAMVYEDEDDFAVLHDTSNLRPPEMDENAYRRLLQEPAREELRRQIPGMNTPTQADLDLLSMRWFAQGVGFVVQNHSERAFNIAAHFSSSTDSTCEFTVPWQSVGPKASAMYTAHEHKCSADRAQLTINDDYGFFVDSVVVTPSETDP